MKAMIKPQAIVRNDRLSRTEFKIKSQGKIDFNEIVTGVTAGQVVLNSIIPLQNTE